MNEVTKLYENCNIKPKQEGYCDWDSDCPYSDIIGCGDECSYWKYEDEAKYPPFTAEKQLKLYKYLCKPFLITTRYYFDKFSITAENTFEWKTMTKVSVTGKTYEECIAKLVNNLWQDLTDAEKAQIKNILESEVRE